MLLCNTTPSPTRPDDITRWNDSYVIRHTGPSPCPLTFPLTIPAAPDPCITHRQTDPPTRAVLVSSAFISVHHRGSCSYMGQETVLLRLGPHGKQRSLTISHLLQLLPPSSISLMVCLSYS